MKVYMIGTFHIKNQYKHTKFVPKNLYIQNKSARMAGLYLVQCCRCRTTHEGPIESKVDSLRSNDRLNEGLHFFP